VKGALGRFLLRIDPLASYLGDRVEAVDREPEVPDDVVLDDVPIGDRSPMTTVRS